MSLPGELLAIDGVRVFVHRSGNPSRKPPLLFVHSLFSSHYQWREVLSRVAARGLSVIAVDLPGSGESDRPPSHEYRYDAAAFARTLTGVMDALSIERAHLVAHAMGGSAAILLMARRPERVDKAVLLAPIAYRTQSPLFAQVLALPYIGPTLLRSLVSRRAFRTALRKLVYVDQTNPTEAWVDYLWERYNRPGGAEATHASWVGLLDPGEVERSVRAVRAPTLVVWGQEDQVSPATWARRIASEIPGAQTRILPGCGHALHEEQPERFTAELLGFIESARSGGSLKRA